MSHVGSSAGTGSILYFGRVLFPGSFFSGISWPAPHIIPIYLSEIPWSIEPNCRAWFVLSRHSACAGAMLDCCWDKNKSRSLTPRFKLEQK